MQYGLLRRGIKWHRAIVEDIAKKPELGKQTFLKVRKAQIRKFWGSFRYRKSAYFLGMSVRKSQICKFLWLIRKFLQNTANFVSKQS